MTDACEVVNQVHAGAILTWVDGTFINLNVTESPCISSMTNTGEVVNHVHAGTVILTWVSTAIVNVVAT